MQQKNYLKTMETTKVFEKNIVAYDENCPLIVNQGGTRSSKTYSILQLLFLIALSSPKKLIISIVSYALPHLKLGAMRDFEDILTDYGINIHTVKNITDSTFYINKSIVEFFGTDNMGKVHGPARDILFINECNFVKYKIFDQLAIRTKKTVFLDFNPTNEFWFHTEILNKLNHLLIKSTYKDNGFLTSEQIERIEAKKNNENWWRVYGLGELGRLEGAILTNWEFGSFDDSLPFSYGLDFGSKDPDAMVKVAIDRKQSVIYVDEIIYNNGLSTNQLASIIKNNNVGSSLVIADSASPRTINDLKYLGINIQGVVKGAGSILEGIKLLQNYKIVITHNSFNLSKELNSWVWLDKKGNVPIDSDNHLIDAMRYAVQTLVNPHNRKANRVL